jgi:hypothetical protein
MFPILPLQHSLRRFVVAHRSLLWAWPKSFADRKIFQTAWSREGCIPARPEQQLPREEPSVRARVSPRRRRSLQTMVRASSPVRHPHFSEHDDGNGARSPHPLRPSPSTITKDDMLRTRYTTLTRGDWRLEGADVC